jgi:indolepyruvate decarboxylase
MNATTTAATATKPVNPLARAVRGDSACYIEVGGGRTDYPAGLAAAHGRLDALYADV